MEKAAAYAISAFIVGFGLWILIADVVRIATTGKGVTIGIMGRSVTTGTTGRGVTTMTTNKGGLGRPVF